MREAKGDTASFRSRRHADAGNWDGVSGGERSEYVGWRGGLLLGLDALADGPSVQFGGFSWGTRTSVTSRQSNCIENLHTIRESFRYTLKSHPDGYWDSCQCLRGTYETQYDWV